MNPKRLAWALDPALMFRDATGFEPDPWQRSVLRDRADRLLLLCHRQAGKSTATGVMALHQALHEPGSLVLLLSPSLRQSGELYRKVSGFYAGLGKPVAAAQETATTLELENGSRIVSLPGSAETVRGFSAPKLVVVDEAAMADDGLFIAVSPMLAMSDLGRLVLISTPMGKRGFFHDQWEAAEGPWRKVKVAAGDCPRIDPAFLAQERRTLGERWYRQEYECSFEETIDQYFSSESIEAAFSDDVQPLFGGMTHA